MNKQELMKAASFIAKRNLTGSVAAVAVRWDQEGSELAVAYYVDGAVSDEEQEFCELTLAELLAEFPDVRSADSSCLSTGNHVGELSRLEGLVYIR